MQVKLALVPLILLMAVFAAGDNKLSAEFQAPARSYLQALRECSTQALQNDDADPCYTEKVRNKTESAATAPGDKAVLDTLTSWDGTALSTLRWAFVGPKS